MRRYLISHFMFRLSLALLAATLCSFAAARAQGPAAPALFGKIEGRTYVSPTGQFKVAIPVLPELGGDITDTPNVVTFQDDFNVHVSIACFQQDATQRWELATRGPKDYLVYFFSRFILSDFKRTFEHVRLEDSAKFLPTTMDGTLLAYLLIPGGTMFADRIPRLAFTDGPPVAKRGNMVFVRNGHVFVISTELAERVIEGKAYSKTTEEEDELLRTRLNDIASKIQFAKPASSPAAKDTAKK